ncbi:MAG: hypothetical protein M1833_004549 [Piccolia ochrophora]|nr:MAG: hypothetical protein M1833_004549 [Piccolia ochrophora]
MKHDVESLDPTKQKGNISFSGQAVAGPNAHSNFKTDSFAFSPTSIQDYDNRQDMAYSQPQTPSAYVAASDNQISPLSIISRKGEQQFSASQVGYHASNTMAQQSTNSSSRQLQLVSQAMQDGSTAGACAAHVGANGQSQDAFYGDSADAMQPGSYQAESAVIDQAIRRQFEQNNNVSCATETPQTQLLAAAPMHAQDSFRPPSQPQPQMWYDSLPYQQPMAIAASPQFPLERMYPGYNLPPDLYIKTEQDQAFPLPSARARTMF